jgi:acetyl esterase/lipase
MTLDRRRFLRSLTAGAAALAAAPSVLGADDADKKTHIYKTVDKCDIKADVYGADDTVRPVALWIHGGALINGSRTGISRPLREGLLKAGFVVVSIDYRLAPETKLPAILEDVRDAGTWLRTKGPELFHIDPNRLAVLGGSAGGYLTLTTGYHEKRPHALVSFWGYGDLTADWLAKPDEFYRKQPEVPKDEALKAVGDAVIAEPPEKSMRGRFYLYCRQQGLWPKEVVGLDPVKDNKAFDPFCPVRNVTPQFPPTLLIHGTRDTDVPYEQSVEMAKELKRHQVEHELLTVTDAGHGLSGAKPDEVAKVYERAIAFVQEHTR